MAKSPATKKLKVPRRTSARVRKAASPYTRPLGELVWAANGLHSAFQFLFHATLRHESVSVVAAKAMWFSFKSDAAAREMLGAVIDAQLNPESEFYRETKWALHVANFLTGRRNDFVHTPMAFNISTNRLIPNPFAAPDARLERLNRQDIAKFAKTLRDDFNALSFYVGHIVDLMTRREPLHQTFFDRPVLLTVPPPQAAKQSSHRPNRAKQRHRHRSSQD